MSDVPTLLPAVRLRADLQLRLLELTELQVLQPARDAGYELRLVGATVLPQRQVIAHTEWGTWLFVDHVEDPTAELYRSKIPVPAEHHAKLVELDRHGVWPDLVWLGHQQEDGWQEGDPVHVPAPAHLREKDSRMELWLKRAFELYAKAAGLVLGAAAAPAALGLAAGAGLDPIVFGGVRHPEAPVVMWVCLARWEWE